MRRKGLFCGEEVFRMDLRCGEGRSVGSQEGCWGPCAGGDDRCPTIVLSEGTGGGLRTRQRRDSPHRLTVHRPCMSVVISVPALLTPTRTVCVLVHTLGTVSLPLSEAGSLRVGPGVTGTRLSGCDKDLRQTLRPCTTFAPRVPAVS